MSRPSWSVPSQWLPLGPASSAFGSWAAGLGSQTGPRTASSTISSTMSEPARNGGLDRIRWSRV